MTSPLSFEWELASDRTIRGDFYPAQESPGGTVIVLHGYKGFKDYGMFPAIGRELSQQWDVITFNFSHNGIGANLTEFTELEKFARNTYAMEQDDLLELVTAVRGGKLPLPEGNQPQPGPVYLLGHSKGGGGALLFALDHPRLVAGVISWNGIAELDLLSPEEKDRMMTEGRAYTTNARTKQEMPLDRIILDDMQQQQERYNLVARISSLQVPAVLIQGEKDMERLLRESAKLTQAQPELAWHLVPDGDHRFNTVHPYTGPTPAFLEAIRLTQLWLEDQSV